MAKIRITDISDRIKLPESVKEALIGLEFPAAEIPEDQKPLHAHNLRGSPTAMSKTPASTYFVKVRVFLQILREKSPRAADWFEENTLVSLFFGWFGFTEEECTLIAE